MYWFLLFGSICTFLSAFQIAVDARAAIVINPENNAVLFEKKADDLQFPASLTKIATALYVVEKEGLDFEREISPSEEALYSVRGEKKQANWTIYPSHRLEHDSTVLGLRPGKKLPLWTAFYGMLICSANDCANALAESYGKSIPDFVASMNRYLQEIGCEKTHFTNPHGLHHPSHVTTARELALIAKKALSYPVFQEPFSAKGFVYQQVGKQARQIEHKNRLVLPNSKFYYPSATGGKNGYTEASLYSLLATAKQGERELLVVLLGAPSKAKSFEEVIKLFESAFSEEKVQSVFVERASLFTKPLKRDHRSVQARLQEDSIACYYPSEKPRDIKAQIRWDELTLPIKQGDRVGEIEVISKCEVLQKKPLYAVRSIDKTFGQKVRSFLRNLFFFL